MLDCSNVSIVIVSFRSEEALSNLLPSIPLECEIIIVNNDSPLPKKIKEIRNLFEIINSENKQQSFDTIQNSTTIISYSLSRKVK